MDHQPFPGARLAALLASRGYRRSSGVIARRAGITPKFLHQMCTDPDVNPTWDTICAVCDAIGYTAADLIETGEDRDGNK